MSFKIRQLQISDLQQGSFFQTLSALRTVDKMQESEAEKIFNDCVARGIETYVLEEDGNIIASARLLFEAKYYHQGRLAAHIEDVATHTDHQGRGLGRALIQHLITVCHEKNCYKIILDCADNIVPFYEKQGFIRYENCLRYYL
ncbi:GNAT family N-acetyltransferase [Patescibacteria group bacterium]|nr:GNAT family N-acetyltransferase [Patescibacteria group bacterium]